MVVHTCKSGAWEMETGRHLGFHWSVRLAYLVSKRAMNITSQEPSLKPPEQGHPRSISGLHTHMHSCTYTHTHICLHAPAHMQTHVHTHIKLHSLMILNTHEHGILKLFII